MEVTVGTLPFLDARRAIAEKSPGNIRQLHPEISTLKIALSTACKLGLRGLPLAVRA